MPSPVLVSQEPEVHGHEDQRGGNNNQVKHGQDVRAERRRVAREQQHALVHLHAQRDDS